MEQPFDTSRFHVHTHLTDVPLGSHENLQLEVGTPLVAPETINWPGTGL